MQIVRGGKLSRLHDLVIRGRTFAIVQQFETPYNRKKKIRWKTFAIRGLSAKTTKVFHRERFALYGITCNMCSHDVPDMYALSPWALGIHIRQIPRAHVTTITYIMNSWYLLLVPTR